MTGLDHEWRKVEGSIDKQNIVLTVHFRPDKIPKDEAEWFLLFSNYAKTTSELMKAGILKNTKTDDLRL